MKITFVLPNAAMLGGTRVVATFAERLRRRGHQVCVISMPRPRLSPRARWRRWWNTGSWRYSTNPGPSHLDGLSIEHRLLDRWRTVQDSDVPDGDVVIATWWQTADGVAALHPSKGAKVYFVMDYGAHSGQSLEQIVPTWRLPMYKITISRWLESLIREQVHPSDPVECIPVSVELEQFQAPERGKQPVPTVGFVYGTRPQKGCAIALEAIRLAREKIPASRVLAIGHDAVVPQLVLPEDATYFLRLAEPELPAVYSRCDAWLFTSLLEGFGLPILEAMACRTPVIATPAGAAPELLARGGGILVGQAEPREIAEALLEIWNMDDHVWRRLSAAAHATATSCTWDDAVDRFEAVLERVLTASSPACSSASP